MTTKKITGSNQECEVKRSTAKIMIQETSKMMVISRFIFFSIFKELTLTPLIEI